MEKKTTIKERILKFIESQQISKYKFCVIAQINAGNITGAGLDSEIGGKQIVKILSAYNELSPDWLLLGRGEMLRDAESVPGVIVPPQKTPAMSDSPLSIYDAKNVVLRDDIVAELKKQIEIKDAQIAKLLDIMESYPKK